MCLNPITLVSPKRKLSLYGGLPYSMQVPCGHCSECQKIMQNEWFFRAYYESKWTFDNGGYIYFDTLTYANEFLPHVSDFYPELKGRISDFSCFNVEHYRLFFVNLRRQLEYHGFDVKNKLKYFLTSEYGTDDRFTHRPHYHVLFYILDGSIDPIVLSKFVAKCWPYGRTDGVDYKGTKYVLDHVFGKKYNSDEVHMQLVANYVSKYVTKDSSFQTKINSRIKIINSLKFQGELTEYQEKMQKKVIRNMNQFHRQSNGFGIEFLRYNDYNEVFETGMISMPSKDLKIKKHIPLPGYYARKIFYDLNNDSNGLRWHLNEEGVKFKINRKFKSIELFNEKFEEWLLNMKNRNMVISEGYLDDDGHRWTKEEVEDWYVSHSDKFLSLLGNRDLKEFVIYLLCYKGRIKTPEQIERESNGIYQAPDLADFFGREFDIKQDFGHEQVYNYAHSSYKKFFNCAFVTNKDLGDKNEWKNSNSDVVIDVMRFNYWKEQAQNFLGFKPSLMNSYSTNTRIRKFGNLETVGLFSSKYVINDKSDPSFEHFDEMYWLWCDSLRYINIEKQKYHDWKLEYSKRMKASGIIAKTV